jgi:hypothetical protein
LWLRPIEGSVADELELADPFFTPDAYLNPKSYPTKIMFSEVTTTTTLSGSAWRITSIGAFATVFVASRVQSIPSVILLYAE